MAPANGGRLVVDAVVACFNRGDSDEDVAAQIGRSDSFLASRLGRVPRTSDVVHAVRELIGSSMETNTK